jgi:hypothetical protein
VTTQHSDLYTGPTPEDLARIPAVLKARRQWVLWRGADRISPRTGAVKLNKIPINPQMLTNADPTDPTTWGTFAVCVAALPVALEEWENDNPGAYRGGGIGYVFTEDDPYTGMDFDNCVEPVTGQIAAWAQAHIDALSSYTEITPSGTGLHSIVEGKLPPKGRKKGSIEMYDYARFFTMTGWHRAEMPPTVEPRQGPLNALWCSLFGPQVGQAVWLLDGYGNITNHNRIPWAITAIEPAPDGELYARFAETSTGWPLIYCELALGIKGQPGPSLFDDATLITKALAADNGAKVQRLAQGQWQHDYPSQSEADLAFCCLLAFWTQDPTQIDRLFRISGLMRAKWDEKRGAQTYGARTIAEALARQTEHYTPHDGAHLLVRGAGQHAQQGQNGTAAGPAVQWGSTAPAPQDWPDPLALPEGLPAVHPFDFALLPKTLRPWAQDICERVQCPPDFVGVALMTALGGVLGCKVGIRPQARTDWTVIPNQWGLTIGRPGVLKSPAMEAALAPVKRLQAIAAEQYQAAIAVHLQMVKLTKLRGEAGEKAARKKLASNPHADVSADLALEEPGEPTMHRYIANDTTAAALGELLRQNPNGLLVFRDELVSLLKSLDREDQAEARGFYLTAWNGDSAYTFDRIGRGFFLHIPAVCLSVLGSTQPGRIAEYLRDAVRGGKGDDGLMQRFGLLVWPDTSRPWREVDRWPDSDARRTAYQVFEEIAQLSPHDLGAQLDEDDTVPYLRFDAPALELFRTWREGLETLLRSEKLHPALEAHFAKYRKLIPGLALLCHIADRQTGAVGEEAILRALSWAEYLDTHARRAYASVIHADLKAAHAILDKLRRGELSHTFAPRDIYRQGWAHLSDRTQVTEALQLLVDHEQLVELTLTTPGRSKHVYQVNRKALS